MDNSIAFGSVFILGALHALEPGHGKSFLASFSLAKDFKWKHILSLISGLLISHFFMLVIIAIILRYVSYQLDEHHLLGWFEWFGPLAVTAFGIYLFIKYKKEKQTKSCSCGHHHKHDHTHKEEHQSLKKVTLAGLIGGLIPCPTAITPLIFSGVDAHFGHVISYLFIYVTGMCITMLGIIGVIYISKQTFTKHFNHLGEKFNFNLISACLIILIGLSYFMIKAINFSNHVHG